MATHELTDHKMTTFLFCIHFFSMQFDTKHISKSLHMYCTKRFFFNSFKEFFYFYNIDAFQCKKIFHNKNSFHFSNSRLSI